MKNYIKAIEASAEVEAQLWFDQNRTPEFELIKNTLVDMDFDNLFDTGDNPVKSAWNEAIEIACKSAHQDSENTIDTYHKAYFRLAEIVGMSTSDFPKGWMSPSLMDGYLEKFTNNTDFKWNRYDYSSIENYFVNDVFDHVKSDSRVKSFSEESLRILLPKDANIVYKDSIAAFVKNGDIDELVCHLYTEADSCLGRIRNRDDRVIDRVDVNCQLVADALSFITKDKYSRHSVRKMLNDGLINKVDFYTTKAFLDHMAPVVTSESLEQHKAYYERYESKELRDKLRSSLSDTQILNSFLKGRNADISEWERALNCFALDTGKRLSFEDAYQMDIRRGFRLENTKQYYQLLDKEFDVKSDTVTSNAKLNWDVEIYDVTEDGETEYIMEVTLHSPALSVDGIYKSLEDAAFEVESNDMSVCWGAEIMLIESREESESSANEVYKNLKENLDRAFPELIKDEPLPGDIVTLVYDQDEDPEMQDNIEFGKKAVVVRRYDDSVKIKGVDNPVPLSNAQVSRKQRLELNHESELSM